MTARRRYRGYRSRGDDSWRSRGEWAEYHRSQRGKVSSRFGGIDQDVERMFLNFSIPALDCLFRDYGVEHGKHAEAYARATYPQWKDGSVFLSGQTALRLLNLVPPRLSAGQRFELIRKLRNHYVRRDSISIASTPADWRQAVLPSVEKIVAKAYSQNLPPAVLDGARWLSSDDTAATQALLARIEEEESRIRTSLLAQEFERIDALMRQLDGTRNSVSHTIRLPHGDIEVKIVDPRAKGGSLLSRFLLLFRGSMS